MNALRKIYPWLLLAPVLLPVVIWGGLIYPYLVPKTLSFYAVSLLSVAAFAVLAARGERFYFGRLRDWAAWIPAALLALAYAASAFGIGFYHSFWSLYVRGDGLLMLTCAVAYFYLILLYATRTFFTRLLYGVAAVGSFVAVYGIGEWLFNGGRVGSLLGNAAFFAGYLGIAFYATLAARLFAPRAWRAWLLAGAALEVAAIVLSATRGTMLALAVALLAALAYYAWKGKGKTASRSRYALAALVLLAALFVGFRGELAHVPFSPVARLASIGRSDPDVASRLFIWKNMISEIEKRPLLGVGAEHIDALFNQFYDPTQIQEQWFDRSHNAFLDYAAQYGIGGFILYALLIGSFFVAARRTAARGEKALAGIFALLALTYAVQNFFVFDTISSFWLLLALLSAFLARSREEEAATALFPARSATAYLAYAAALALVCLIYPASLRPAEAAYDLAHGYALALSDPSASDAYLKSGFALGTYGDIEFGYEAYDMYANHQYGTLSGDALVQAYATSEAILAANYARYSYDARTALYLAHVLSLAPAGVATDNELLENALARAISESPKRTQPWYILVNLSLAQANSYPQGSSQRAEGYAAAEDLLNKYLALVPTLSEPHYVLADLLYAEGKTADAEAEAALGKQYYGSDGQTAVRAAQFYEKIQDFKDAQFFLKEVMELDPSNYALIYDLAKVDYVLGDPASALVVVHVLEKEDPSILATDQNFLNALAAYESR